MCGCGCGCVWVWVWVCIRSVCACVRVCWWVGECACVLVGGWPQSCVGDGPFRGQGEQRIMCVCPCACIPDTSIVWSTSDF